MSRAHFDKIFRCAEAGAATEYSPRSLQMIVTHSSAYRFAGRNNSAYGFHGKALPAQRTDGVLFLSAAGTFWLYNVFGGRAT
jgi:hypothetical protein